MFEKLKAAIDRLLSGSREEPFRCNVRVFTLQVKCDRCGEIISARINRDHELQEQYAEDAEEGDPPVEWLLHKEVVGSECQNIVRFTLHFGCDQGLLDSSIEGGEFVTPEIDNGLHENGEAT